MALAAAALAAMTRFGGARPGQPVPAVTPVAAGLLVPVARVTRASLVDNWGDPRDSGTRTHHGLDIPAPRGTLVIAAAAGTFEKLFASRLGGIALYLRSADGATVYYYAHLAGYVPGVAEGRAVRAGDPVGFVGDSGDAGPGNTHLHFGVQRMRPGERWWEGRDVDPYPLLAGHAPPL